MKVKTSMFTASLFCRLCVTLLLLCGVLGGIAVHADQQQKPLRLIELFTSHGCSSCPSADRLLRELMVMDEELLALEYHVDYWDSLVHGSAGSFTDPFSKAEFSMRQRAYSAAGLKGRPGVYTPQAIINGSVAVVGSNRRHVMKALKTAYRPAFSIQIVELAGSDADQLQITIDGADDHRQQLRGTDVSLVRYIDQASTQITGGENRNLTLLNHHIVRSLMQLGEVTSDGTMQFIIEAAAPGHGCLILIQEAAQMPVYAAANCP